MRRLRILFVVAVALSPATASATSFHTAECEAVCANPDPSVDQNLSPDPRTFATIANGYTSYWQECHAETDAVQKPKTCREWCAARERGRALLETSGLIGSFLDADTYNNLWRAWGALERPDLGSRIGIGNTAFDIEVFSYDLGKAGGVPIPLPYPHNQGRGTINAVSDFEFLMTLRDFDTLDSTPFVKAFPAHASPGDQ